MPLNRNETLQEGLGIPLPASTQWDIVADQAERAEPVFEELVRQAAQGDVLYNDDTTVKILAMMDRQALAEDLVDEPVEESAKDGSVEDSAEMPGDAAGSGTSPCQIPTCGSQSATEKPGAQAQGHVHHGRRRGELLVLQDPAWCPRGRHFSSPTPGGKSGVETAPQRLQRSFCR